MIEEKLPKRKPNRIKNYDYSSAGAYFITICIHEKRCILADIVVGATIGRPPAIMLTSYGKIVDEAVNNIENCYPAIFVDNYVIMPNHIHLLLRIDPEKGGRPMVAPTISTVIQQMKGYTTKYAGTKLWQKLFHDHVIRNERDYLRIWNYIDINPGKWTEDCFYIPTTERQDDGTQHPPLPPDKL